LAFGVTVHGSLAALSVITLLGDGELRRHRGPGGVTHQQRRDRVGLMNLVMMPMWVVSGVFFSYERFPEALHPLVQALPAHRAQRLAAPHHEPGQGLAGLGSEIAVMSLWGVLSFALALRLFRWQ
jgi:ABC-2 type transport system permease protein